MRILPVFSHLAPDSWNAVNLPRYWDVVAAHGGGRHVTVASADDADVFVFLGSDEPFRDGLHKSIRLHPLFTAQPRRCFAWDFTDRPVGLLPGLYASLPRRRFGPRYEAFCYLMQPNPDLEAVHDEGRGPDLLFSFMGALNARVRHRLSSLAGVRGGLIIDTTRQPQWFRQTSDATDTRRRYADVLARSRFVLCPRGVGTSSYRIFEAMQLARVPVILSDAWVPPALVAWETCSVRVPEQGIAELPGLLRALEPRAAEMGALARRAWEQHFAPGAQLEYAGDAIERIVQRVPARELGPSWQWPLRALEYRTSFEAGRAVAAAAQATRTVRGWMPTSRAL